MDDAPLLPVPASQSDQQELPAEEHGFLSSVLETGLAIPTGIPPQVQRSFFKAAHRIIVASAEIPAQWLEDKAAVGRASRKVQIAKSEAEVADIKSRQKARELIDKETAKAAAKQFTNPELASRAVDFHAAHIVREQKNREDVLNIAAEELNENPPTQDSNKEVDDDWLTAFLREASTRSSDDFKILFGKILAGELKAPGTFSIGTIQSLGRLTSETAEVFQIACNCSISILFNPKVVSEPFGHAGENHLEKFGLNYLRLVRLVEEGLLRSDFSEWQQVPSVLYEQNIPFEFAGKKYLLLKDTTPSAPDIPTLRLSGPAFTQAGKELRQIVTMVPDDTYLRGFAAWWKKNGLILHSVLELHPNGQARIQRIEPE